MALFVVLLGAKADDVIPVFSGSYMGLFYFTHRLRPNTNAGVARNPDIHLQE